MSEDINEKFDPADLDMVATDKDKAGAKMNIIMQLRKAADVKGNLPIKFADGKSAKLPPKVIELALKKFASFRKPDSKEKLQTAMNKSYKDMVNALKTMREETEELGEGFSPKEIKMAIGVATDKRYKGGNMTGATQAIDKIKKGLSDHPQVRAVLKRVNEDLEEGVDKAKIQKQIDQTEKHMKTFFGNTSSVKMKKFAMQKKIEKLKAQLKEVVSIEEGQMAGWIAIYKGKKIEIKKDQAKDLYGAKQLAIKQLKVPKSGQGILSITPAYESVNESFEIVQDGGKTEVTDIQEAPSYKLHHNTFSGAVQEAIAVAKKQGYDVDEDDWSNKVATGPKKPSKDKTNRYSIKLLKGGKPTRKFLQIQVYNMGSKYELNCYVQ
jgi:hypothetical protein